MIVRACWDSCAIDIHLLLGKDNTEGCTRKEQDENARKAAATEEKRAAKRAARDAAGPPCRSRRESGKHPQGQYAEARMVRHRQA